MHVNANNILHQQITCLTVAIRTFPDRNLYQADIILRENNPNHIYKASIVVFVI